MYVYDYLQKFDLITHIGTTSTISQIVKHETTVGGTLKRFKLPRYSTVII